MAIQTPSASRARSDAVVGAVIVAAAAIIIAAIFTFLDSAPGTVSWWPQDTRDQAATAEQAAVEKALIDVRAGERAMAAPVAVEVMSDVRMGEKLPVTPLQEKAAVENALIQIRAAERAER